MSRFSFLCAFLVLLGLVSLRSVSAVCTGPLEEQCFVLDVVLSDPGNNQADVSVTFTYDFTGATTEGVVTGAAICSVATTSTIEYATGFGNNAPQTISLSATGGSDVSTSLVGGNLVVSNLALFFTTTVTAGNNPSGDVFNGHLSISSNTVGQTLTFSSGLFLTPALPPNSPFTQFSGDAPITNNCNEINGDPQFVGMRGQSFQVHGIDGAVYNIITEKNLQINARFTFLAEGKCPIIDGVPQDNCWSHPGSYISEMSFQQRVDGKLHAALVGAGKANKGFQIVQMDGKQLQIGDTVNFGSFSIAFDSAYQVTVTTEHFRLELSNSDMFLNQAVATLIPMSQLKSHGLLGQTHNAKLHPSPLKYIEGEVDDYVIVDGNIYGSSAVFNLFEQ